jgi:hypothetical protein
MARKKRAKRAGKNVRRGKKSAVKYSQPRNKIKLVFGNLLLFVVLTVLSWILFNAVNNVILVNLFQIMAIAFGFISVGLLIALLVLIIVKNVRKSK